MPKILKGILIAFVSLILLIFIALLVTPLLFKTQIMTLAKTELNKMLLAKVDFKDLKLSFIRNFPNAYVALEGLEVTGINEFEDELLVAFDRFSVTANILSVIKMEKIEVKSVLLENARLNGHILEDGKTNWDIVKPDETKEKAEEATEEKKEEGSSPFVFNVALNKFEIRKLGITFRDDAANMAAEAQELNFTLRGDMARENVDLKMELAIDRINFWMGGVRLLNKATVGFISEIAADLKNMDFVLKDNKFNLNDIVLKLNGSAGIKGDDINLDIAFATERTDFKSLLSLIPAIYMNDFKDLKTTGSLDLSGKVKGTFNSSTMPSADAVLSVNNATFSYPDLPKSVEKVNIAAKLHYDGEVFDRTTVDVNRFTFEMAGNPFNAELHAKTPESDLQFSAMFAGKIDFNSIRDVVPLDDILLNGLLECNISLAGKMSMLEKQRYEDFKAAGSLKINGFVFNSPDLPKEVRIAAMQMNFTPRRVDLARLDASMGGTDIALNGSLENFIPFVLKNETVRGTLALKSNTINLNELMEGEPAEKEAAAPEEALQSQLSVIEVPKNIDFTMTINAGTILFDKLRITNTAGAITVKDGKLTMRNLRMNLLEGSMALNGEYNTRNIASPSVDLGLDIKQFEISSALSSFSILEKILPEPQNYVGKVSGALTLNSVLDEHMSPVLNTVNSRGKLQTQNLEIRNSKLFGTLADLIKNEKWRTPAPGNVNVAFEIKDGRLLIDPIPINITPVKLEISGDQGLDMTLNYRVNAAVPVSAIGSSATGLLSSIPGGSRINEIKVTGRIQGTAKNPDVSLSAGDMAASVAGAVKEQVTEKVTQKAEEITAKVNEEVNRQIDTIMAEAQKQADNLRSGAKQAADRARSEANTAADKLASEAAGGSIIQQRLSQAAADKLRSEGEASAKKLEQEAENKAKTIMDAAQAKANELRKN